MSRVFEELDPAYATACSDVTLCSSTRGFFHGFANDLADIAENSGWLDSLEKTEDDLKITFVLENEEIMNSVTEVFSRIQPLYRGKDARVSNEKRLAAQAALAQGDLQSAFGLASQAVLRAPMTGVEEVIDGGISLALALWTRSEILMLSNRPVAALEDLRLALKERLPAKMRAQYYWRMGHCYKGAGETSRAKVSYELAARLLGADEVAKAELTKDIEGLDYTVQPKTSSDRKGIEISGGAKQNMPALSTLLKIVEEENKGRFAVAGSSIKTGDVLLLDNPYAACLLPDYYGTHCLHCFKSVADSEDEAPVWCPTCSGVVFCSIKCRDVAISSYHLYECQFLDLFIGSGMSILSHISLRMVTQAGLDTCLSIHSKFISNGVKTVDGAVLNDIEGIAKRTKIKSRKERLNRHKRGLKTLNDNKKDDDAVPKMVQNDNIEDNLELKAAQIYSLCTHSQQRKGRDYFKRIMMGMFLIECLKQADFFKNNNQENKKDELSICELLVQNLQILQFNAHEIYETQRSSHLFNGSKPIYIAVGIYPTGALFNHECYPAVARYFEGRKIVLRATRPLSPGEIVSENYGPHFMVRNLKERQRSLASRYWFRCECVACTENWPTLKQMAPDSPPLLRCSKIYCPWNFHATPKNLPNRCPKCSTIIDKDLLNVNVETVNRCISMYKEGALYMDAEKADEALQILADGINIFHEVARTPHRDTHLAQEALRSCFAANGNMRRVQTKKLTDASEKGIEKSA